MSSDIRMEEAPRCPAINDRLEAFCPRRIGCDCRDLNVQGGPVHIGALSVWKYPIWEDSVQLDRELSPNRRSFENHRICFSGFVCPPRHLVIIVASSNNSRLILRECDPGI